LLISLKLHSQFGNISICYKTDLESVSCLTNDSPLTKEKTIGVFGYSENTHTLKILTELAFGSMTLTGIRDDVYLDGN
jgi:hypothetical protein